MLRTAIVLTVLFVLDLGYSGQGLISMLVAIAGVAVLALRALWAFWGGQRAMARSRATRAAMYLTLGAATLIVTHINAATAESHAAQIIDACRAYQARRGILPDRLQQLVPEFLPAVPRAKYTMAWGEFTYFAAPGASHTLVYVTLPPFGRRVYNFEQAAWSQRD